MEYTHRSVMLEECINALNIKPDGVYIDGTAGLGGHSEAIAKRLTTGTLLCLDKDTEALAYCEKRLAAYKDSVRLIHSDFRHLEAVLRRQGIETVDGLLLDLGVSSLQLDKPERGFSYRFDAPLDMRMDGGQDHDAGRLVNTADARTLKEILYKYGEERYAPSIADAIVRHRPIETTGQLTEIISAAMPAKARREQHPAKRSFQAFRIAVNDELGALEEVLGTMIDRLRPGGRIAILTFHSLEDRIVKNALGAAAVACTCPPSFPACVCGLQPRMTRQAREWPSQTELENNSRSASAKLRWAERL